MMMVAAEQDFLLGVKAIVNIFIEPKNGSKVHIPGFQDMPSRPDCPTHAASLLPCRAAATA
jgi:hypothetical protein